MRPIRLYFFLALRMIVFPQPKDSGTALELFIHDVLSNSARYVLHSAELTFLQRTRGKQDNTILGPRHYGNLLCGWEKWRYGGRRGEASSIYSCTGVQFKAKT